MTPSKQDLEIILTMVTSTDDVVYLSGSRVEGLGNDASDIDVYVIVSTPYSSFRQPALRRGYYIDCEYWTEADLLACATRFNDPSKRHSMMYHNHTRMRPYYDTCIGIPLQNVEQFAELQRHFSKDTFAAVYATICKTQATQLLRRAHAYLQIQDLGAAGFSARTAANLITESYLARHGHAYPGPKWRFQKAARLLGRESDAYRQFWRLSSFHGSDIASYVHLVTGLFKDFCGPFTGEDSRQQTYVLQQATDVRLFQTGSIAVLVKGEGIAYPLSPSGVVIWKAMVEPQTIAQLSDIAREWFSIESMPAVTLVEEFIAGLSERDLIDHFD